MDKIILGFLMLRGMTIYEIKTNLNTKLESMCSSSSGSIHTAIKKLLESSQIACEEDGNKKIYYITEKGRIEFNSWIHEPMLTNKHKDIELSKLFFGGLADPTKRKELIEAYIMKQKENLKKLELIRQATTFSESEIQQTSDTLFSGHMKNEEGVCKSLYQRDENEVTKDIYQYQMLTLQFGIDSTKFIIDWYQKLLEVD